MRLLPGKSQRESRKAQASARGRLAATLTTPTLRLKSSASISAGLSVSTARSARGLEPLEAARQIGDQIVEIFESGMEAQARPRVPRRGAAQALGMGRQDEALEPAPGRAHAEELKSVEHRIDRLLGDA